MHLLIKHVMSSIENNNRLSFVNVKRRRIFYLITLIIFTISTKNVILFLLISSIAKSMRQLIVQQTYTRFVKNELRKFENNSTISNLEMNCILARKSNLINNSLEMN